MKTIRVYPNLDVNELVMKMHEYLREGIDGRVILFHIESKIIEYTVLSKFVDEHEYLEYRTIYTLVVISSNVELTNYDYNDIINKMRGINHNGKIRK
jgi:hypothetical protein